MLLLTVTISVRKGRSNPPYLLFHYIVSPPLPVTSPEYLPYRPSVSSFSFSFPQPLLNFDTFRNLSSSPIAQFSSSCSTSSPSPSIHIPTQSFINRSATILLFHPPFSKNSPFSYFPPRTAVIHVPINCRSKRQFFNVQRQKQSSQVIVVYNRWVPSLVVVLALPCPFPSHPLCFTSMYETFTPLIFLPLCSFLSSIPFLFPLHSICSLHHIRAHITSRILGFSGYPRPLVFLPTCHLGL